MLWLIDSCQNKADQYNVTISWAQVKLLRSGEKKRVRAKINLGAN